MTNFAWTKNLGHNIIQSYELVIGDYVIESGVWDNDVGAYMTAHSYYHGYHASYPPYYYGGKNIPFNNEDTIETLIPNCADTNINLNIQNEESVNKNQHTIPLPFLINNILTDTVTKKNEKSKKRTNDNGEKSENNESHKKIKKSLDDPSYLHRCTKRKMIDLGHNNGTNRNKSRKYIKHYPS